MVFNKYKLKQTKYKLYEGGIIRKKSILNDYQKDYIRENYPYKSNIEIAEILGCEKKHVKSFADREKLRKGNNSRVYLNEEEKDYIRKWYNIIPTRDIAEHLGYTTKKINDFAYGTMGVLRNIKRKTIDDSYFEVIDTPNKAYWLGFLYADGCVTETKKSKYLDVALASTDEFHLDRLRMSLSSDSEIKHKVIKEKYHASRVIFCNKKLCEDLIKLGCTPRKSLTLRFPNENQVPKYLQSHFIRGYFDGDGCVYVSSENNNTTKCSVSFVGTKEFLESLQDILNKELGLTKTVVYKKADTNAYSCAWGGKSNMKSLYDFLYKGQDIIYLTRKREKFSLYNA